jgi:hypothetical protein
MVTSMPSQRPELKTFMKIKAAKAFSWRKHSLMGDEHKSISKLAHHFQVEHNRCIYQAYFEGHKRDAGPVRGLLLFYILEALNKPWGPGAHFKCTCEDCFRDCTCHHSLMMLLLCKDDAKPDAEAVPLSMPAEYRTCCVPTRRHKRGRPTASAASTLGDSKAMDLASDEEERIEPISDWQACADL